MANTIKPTLPKGTRDFNTGEMRKRMYIIDTIKSVYELYGFSPIETPAFENLETLTGKYGEEGDRLIFKILNSGDYLKKVDQDVLNNLSSTSLTRTISEKALRYDLTVPFARFVVQHQNDLNFPFKRYQVQPVWRADRPQKGRYREFYQCDADVIGSSSLLNEAELLMIIQKVFKSLNVPVDIKVNNRKILKALAEYINVESEFTKFTVIIDKIDKIGVEKVEQELLDMGVSIDKLNQLNGLFDAKSGWSYLAVLENALAKVPSANEGFQEVHALISYLKNLGYDESMVVFDPLLARGLDYYTGTIIEVVARDVKIGSICGGGRYDDLTEIFGLSGVSGVGISFGIDRIYDVIEASNLFPESTSASIQIMLANLGEEEMGYALPILAELRQAGVHAIMYPDNAKLKKQLKYADAINVKWVGLAGSQEIEENKITLKQMGTGEQEKVDVKSLVNFLKS